MLENLLTSLLASNSNFLRAPDGEGAGGSFFNAGEGGEGGQGEGEGEGGEGQSQAGQGEGGERPDWLKEKYKTVEDQAKAYNDLFSRFSKKTDDLRAEVRGEVEEQLRADFAKAAGVPEDVGDYAYADGISPAAEALDSDLRDWAKKHGVGVDGFRELTELYGKTLPNHEAEKAQLGENADDRIDAVGQWIKDSLDPSHFGAVQAAMTTAAGVEMFEALMDASSERGFAPEGGSDSTPLTRDAIRELQADPKFGVDEAYTARVRGLWAKFAAKQK